MRLHRLDLNLLIALDALLLEANVTRAAVRLNVSQTTLSGALARLRAHFNDELLVQRGRGMVLTPLAQGLRAPVRSILLQAETVALRRTDFDPAKAKAAFSILALDAVHAVFTRLLCQRLSHEAPGITLSLEALSRLEDFTPLESNDVQFVIIPSFATTPLHPSMPLYDERMVCIADASHHFKDTLSLEDYMSAAHIIAQERRSPGFESHDTTALRLMGHRRKRAITVTSYVLMPTLVAGTPYLATVPRRLALMSARTLPLRVFDLPFETPRLTETLQWHRSLDSDPAVIWLRGMIHDIAARF